MTVVLSDAGDGGCELEKIHYLAEIFSFQDKAERASAEGGVYVEPDIVYLRQASAYVVDRLIFKNHYTIAPGAVLVQVYILTDGLDSIFYLKVFAGLQCCSFSGVCDLYFTLGERYGNVAVVCVDIEFGACGCYGYIWCMHNKRMCGIGVYVEIGLALEIYVSAVGMHVLRIAQGAVGIQPH